MQFNIFAVNGVDEDGLIVERTDSDGTTRSAYFWLDEKGGLAPTPEIRRIFAGRCYPIPANNVQRQFVREILAYARAADRTGNHRVRKPPQCESGGYAKSLNRFFTGDQSQTEPNLRALFVNWHVFSTHVFEKVHGSDEIGGRGARFGVRQAIDPGGRYEPSRLFAPVIRAHDAFGGRQGEIHRLNQFIAQERGTYCLVTGPAGYGKSALLSHWLSSIDQDEVKVVAHFVSRLVYGGTDERFFLESICVQLGTVHGIGVDLRDDNRRLRWTMVDLLKREPPRPFVVVIDGLDEALPLWCPDEALFPQDLPRNVKVVLSARDSADVNWAERLGLRLSEDSIIHLDRLTRQGIREAMEGACLAGAVVDRAAERVYDLSGGDPFYVHDLLYDLEASNGDLGRLEHYPVGHSAFLKKWWADGWEACGTYEFLDLMGSLAVARAPVGRELLLALSPHDLLRGGSFDALIASAARYLVGNERDGYQLSNNRITDFVLTTMADEIRGYRQRFADLCRRWKEAGLPRAVREYALSYGAEHIADVGGWRMLVDLLHEDWAAARREQTGHDAALMGDVETAIRLCMHAEDVTEALVALFQLARWKAGYGRSLYNNPFYGVEHALRIRLGIHGRAREEVDYYGSKEDRLYVHAELSRHYHGSDRTLAQQHFGEVERLSVGAASRAIEVVAILLSCVAPEWGLRVAQLIPDADYLLDMGGSEVPNRHRAVFQILQSTAERDIEQALGVLGNVDEEADKLCGAVAIVGQLIVTDPRRAGRILDHALSDIREAEHRLAARWAILRFLFWQVQQAGVALCDPGMLETLGPLFLLKGAPPSLLDDSVRENPDAWRASIERMSLGQPRDFLLWRLTALGVVDPSWAIQATTDENFRSMIVGIRISQAAETDPINAESELPNINGSSGYWNAVIRLAERIATFDEAASVTMIKPLLAELEQEEKGDWSIFLRAVDALRVVMPTSSETRNELLRWCVFACVGMQPDILIKEAKCYLGRMIANAIPTKLPDAVDFVKCVVEGQPLEDVRRAVLDFLLLDAPDATCERISAAILQLVKHDEARYAGAVDQCVLLPETAISILTRLAERLTGLDALEAEKVLRYAVSISDSVNDGRARDKLIFGIRCCAARIRPTLVWKILPDNDGASVLDAGPLAAALKSESSAVTRRKETWLRMAVAWALDEDGTEGDASSKRQSAGRWAGFREVSRYENLTLHSDHSWRASEAWLRDIPPFYADLARPQGKDAQGHILRECNQLLAMRDWPTFMIVAGDSTTARLAVEDPHYSGLDTTVMLAPWDTRSLVEDLKRLMLACESAFSNSGPTPMRIGQQLAAVAAVYCPELSIDIMRVQSNEERSRTVDDLAHRVPVAQWSNVQLDELVGLFTSDGSAESAARLKFLQWYGGTFELPAGTRRHLANVDPFSTDVGQLQLIAALLCNDEPQTSAELHRVVLERALSEGDGCVFLTTFDIVSGSIGDADGADRLREYVEEWWNSTTGLRLREQLTAERADTLLESLSKGSGPNAEKALRVLARHAAIEGSGALTSWISKIRQHLLVCDETKDGLIADLVRRAILTGVSVDLSHIRSIDAPGERTRLFVAYMRHSGRPPDDVIVDECQLLVDEMSDSNEKSEALVGLAQGLCDEAPGTCMRVLKKALDLAERQENCYVFATGLRAPRRACVAYPGEDASALARCMRTAVDRYDFASSHPLYVDTRVRALLEVASSFFRSNEETFRECMADVVEEYKRFGRRNAVFVAPVIDTWCDLRSRMDMECAMRFLATVLEAIPERMRAKWADHLCEVFLLNANEDNPLGRHEVWVHGPRIEVVPALRWLLPKSSMRTQMEVHLNLAVALAQHDPDSAKQHAERAVEQLRRVEEHDDGPLSDVDLRQTIWTVFAIFHGVNGCQKALGELLLHSPKEEIETQSLLTAATEHVADRDDFLRRIWSCASLCGGDT